MKERSIPFSAPMVLAILEDRKDMTRRLIRHPLLSTANDLDEFKGSGTMEQERFVFHDNPKSGSRIVAQCPYEVGQRLWVAETWTVVNHEGVLEIAYRADGATRHDEQIAAGTRGDRYAIGPWYYDLISGGEKGWRPPRFMPRWASRIDLEVVAVRAERLHDMPKDDLDREGIDATDVCSVPLCHCSHWQECNQYKEWVRVWDSIHGNDHPWSANDWVWTVEFRRLP